MLYNLKKYLSLINIRNNLSQKFRGIVMHIHIYRPSFIYCRSFSYNMVGNNLRLILQHRTRNRGVTENTFVTAKDLGRFIDRNAHHECFVLNHTNVFTTLCHVKIITTKRRTITTILFLRHPIYQQDVHIYYKTFPRTLHDCVSSMV